MLAWVFACAACVCACVWWVAWARVRGHWAARGVPHTPDSPHPLFGSLGFVGQKNVGLWMREIYQSSEAAPLVGAWWGWTPALVVNCPRLAREVLGAGADNFRDHTFAPSAHDPIGALNVFMVKEPLWSWVRRRLTPMFTSAKLRALHPQLLRKGRELAQRIHDGKDKPIELRSTLTDYSTDVISVVVLGAEGGATLAGDSALRRVTRDLQGYDVYRGMSWAAIFLFPKLVNIIRARMFPRSTSEFFRALYESCLRLRGGYDAPDTGDMFDVLKRLRQDQLSTKESEELTPALVRQLRAAGEELLVAQSLIMVQGGFDTTANTLSFALYELAHQPDAQKKLYEEMKETKEKLGHDEFDWNTLTSLVYLNAVIKETLRKHPPMGWLDRQCAREYRLGDVTLPAGARVYVNAIGMHYDPRYFPEPDWFDPDRFLPENEQALTPFAYMPFGEGPRNCIGARFAQSSLRSSLARLALAFALSPAPGAPPLSRAKIDTRGMFYAPGEPLYVVFTPREQL